MGFHEFQNFILVKDTSPFFENASKKVNLTRLFGEIEIYESKFLMVKGQLEWHIFVVRNNCVLKFCFLVINVIFIIISVVIRYY